MATQHDIPEAVNNKLAAVGARCSPDDLEAFFTNVSAETLVGMIRWGVGNQDGNYCLTKEGGQITPLKQQSSQYAGTPRTG